MQWSGVLFHFIRHYHNPATPWKIVEFFEMCLHMLLWLRQFFLDSNSSKMRNKIRQKWRARNARQFLKNVTRILVQLITNNTNYCWKYFFKRSMHHAKNSLTLLAISASKPQTQRSTFWAGGVSESSRKTSTPVASKLLPTRWFLPRFVSRYVSVPCCIGSQWHACATKATKCASQHGYVRLSQSEAQPSSKGQSTPVANHSTFVLDPSACSGYGNQLRCAYGKSPRW
jgi:hypothetical protein